jgi:hypothetical protein
MRFALLVSASLSLLPFAIAANAEQIIGLTTSGGLISFDSATPGTTSSIGAVTGLTAGDTIVGIDRRPQGTGGIAGPNNGRLYAVGVNLANGTGRIYSLNEATAAATLVSTLSADPADTTPPFPFTTVAGTSFGVDFNPTVDRLRVVSNVGQNLRLNVDNGLTNLDVPLAYEAGDINFGDAPVDVAIAYANNFGGAAFTTLRGVDVGQDPDVLAVHTNPNGGSLQTALVLPFNSQAESTGYDISGLSATPYFSVTPIGATSSQLFAVGGSGVTLVGTIGGGVALRDIAAPVGLVVPEPATSAAIVAIFAVTSLLRRSRS